jgi:hypothetical protein
MSNITTAESSVITVSGASWAFVQAALGGTAERAPGFANITGEQEWVALAAEALTAAGLDPAAAHNAILSATRAGFGAERHVELSDSAKIATIPDEIGGEWRVLLPENITWAQWVSSGSGSSITVEAADDDTWTVTGSFPVEDGERVEDGYFQVLMDAICREDQPPAWHEYARGQLAVLVNCTEPKDTAEGNEDARDALVGIIVASEDKIIEVVGNLVPALLLAEHPADWADHLPKPEVEHFALNVDLALGTAWSVTPQS